MATSDSMFKFDILVTNVICLLKCKKFYLRSDFEDTFSFYLKNSNQEKTRYIKSLYAKGKRKKPSKVTCDHGDVVASDPDQSVTFHSNIKELRDKMRLFPLELTILTSHKKPQTGSNQFPWKSVYFDFLDSLYMRDCPCELTDSGIFNLYHDNTSKHVATVYLQITLKYLGNGSVPRSKNTIYNIGSDPHVDSTKTAIEDVLANPGVIKTKYRGRELREYIESKKKQQTQKQKEEQKENIKKDINENLETSALSKVSLLSDEDNLLSEYFLNYDDGIYRDQVFCVGYCAVQNDSPSPKKSKTETPKKSEADLTEDDNESIQRYKIKLCEDTCPVGGICADSVESLDLPESSRPFITVTKCKDITCDNKQYRKLPTPVDSKILIDIHKNPCCAHGKEEEPGSGLIQKVEEVLVGGTMTAAMKLEGQDPCYCACECRFGLVKTTTYCTVCGGYETKGDDLGKTLISEMPHPCPLYHKLMDRIKSRSQNLSTSGSGSKKNVKPDRAKSTPGTKESDIPGKDAAKKPTAIKGSETDKKISTAAPSGKKAGGKEVDKAVKGSEKDKKTPSGKKAGGKEVDKSIESDKDSKNGKKSKTKDDRFKFNYGYQGIPPQIGHSQCGLKCTHLPGEECNVPKDMGWLWNAEDVPGLKFRPCWKPGASNKHVVRLLKCAKNPGQVISKKKRKKEAGRRKNDKRPTLIVHKKDGEYNILMETMKVYPKERTFNQYPYEDKPLLSYTIGRTEEENREREKKKERRQRRLERAQREFMESSFKNMCEDICLKTYQQALNFLPTTEQLDCPCFPANPNPDKLDYDRSCSCSEDNNSLDSETDSDEWILEFTPPNAKFDAKFKPKKIVKVDNSSQYTYLDYRVKLLDRQGNQVPRFFKGPDGKEQCSDLGGFWSPDKKWLEINEDGYIAPDGRWAPNSFIGPGGEVIDGEEGKWQAPNGFWLTVGVDGYVDAQGKWKFNAKGKRIYSMSKPPEPVKAKRGGGGDEDDENEAPGKKGNKGGGLTNKKSMGVWSCFGDNISAKFLSEMGIMGHGHDKDMLQQSLKQLMARGEKVNIPKSPTIPRRKGKASGVKGFDSHTYFEERTRCKHPVPTDKGIIAVDNEGNKTYFKLAQYKNKRPYERVNTLQDQGYSLSSFHLPCLHSFISSEIMKKQQRDRIFALAAKHVATQVGYN